MPSLAREIALLPVETAWLDGEVVVLREGGLPDFNALQNAFDKRQGLEQLTYFLFDALFVDGRELRGEALRTRREVLEAIMSRHEQHNVRLSQIFNADGASVLNSACKMGLEGIIAKRLNSAYRGNRDDSWLKIKCQRRQSFLVGGFVVRSGSAKEVGSLLLGVYDDEARLRYAGSVGTGWDSATAVDLLTMLSKLEVANMPFDLAFPPTKGRWSKRSVGSERWVKPSLVVEVSFTEWTPDEHIRHPSFQGVRKGVRSSVVRREVGR